VDEGRRITGTVKSAFHDVETLHTEVVMSRPGFDDWTLIGEAVEVVMKLRGGDPLTVEFSEDGKTARVVVSEEVALYEEVVDGEIVEEAPAADIRWEQWYKSPAESRDGRTTTVFKLEVDESWYRRVDRGLMDELNAYAEGLASVARRSL
jgi:hypothetical protein